MKKEHELTERQTGILSFIYEYRLQHGYSPSIREIGDAVGIRSTSAVSYQVGRLVQAGYVQRVDVISRSFTLLEPAYLTLGVTLPQQALITRLRQQIEELKQENRRLLALCRREGGRDPVPCSPG